MTSVLTPVPGKTYCLDREGRKVGLIMKEDLLAEEYFKPPPKRQPRKQTDAQTVWVSETELPEFIPYSLKEIRDLRKKGRIRPYSDIRENGRRVMYNLLDVSAQIRAGRPVQSSKLVQFDPEGVEITI